MSPTSAIPPGLPPSVEEAYRRKCIQLKQRTTEVEEANDGARLRLNRLKRQVEKMRLERAFLLEQLARRTSTNVEDSDGSPSPPPTPKDKPLRIKRGHRKPSLLPNAETPPVPSPSRGSKENPHHTPSPTSDSFSHAGANSRKAGGASATTNGTAAGREPTSAFELYCRDTRPGLEKEREKRAAEAKDNGDETTVEDNAEDTNAAIEEELARGWKDLARDEREAFQTRYEKELADADTDKDKEKEKEKEKKEKRAKSADADTETAEAPESGGTTAAADEGDGEREASLSINASSKPADADKARESTPKPQDEDVEMENYDTDADTQAEKQDE